MKTKIVSLILLTVILGCDSKNVARTVHEGEKPTGTILTPDQTAVENIRIENMDSEQVLQRMASANTPATILGEMDQIEKVLFDPKSLADRESRYAKKMENLLSAYNSGILKLAEQNGDLNPRLNSYEKALLEGCDAQLKGCLNILFFKKDYRSLDVILKLVDRVDKSIGENCQGECLKNIKKYYDLLGVAYDVKNTSRHTEMEFFYLKRGREYARYYNSLPDNEKQSDFFHRHGLIFENIVSQYPADPKSPRFAEFVKAFRPWSYSRLNADPFPFGVQRMFNYAASHYLYSGEDLNKDLIEAISSSQNESDKMGVSFTKSIEDLVANPQSKQIFRNLTVDPDIAMSGKIYNEYFFMIDRLYRGHLAIDEVNAIWSGSKKDSKKLVEVMAYYVKVEIIKKIIKTNQHMAEIFQRKDIPSDALFKKVIQDSEPLAKEWGIVLGNIDRVETFVVRQIRDSRAQGNTLNEARDILASVKSNIQFLSTYPNMLLMGYVMVYLNASAKFTTWFGMDLTIDPNTVINLLLDGEHSPWFFFSADMTKLDRSQLIYAYHYALNTGAFETYSVIKDEKNRTVVDRVSFFRKVFKQALKSELEEIETAIRSVKDKTQGHQAYAAFINACQQEFQNKKNYTVTVPLVELQTYAVFGNKGAGLLQQPSEFYSYAGPTGAIGTIRGKIEPRLAQIKAMLGVLKANIAKMDSSAQTMAQIQEAEADIQSIENLKKQFYKEVYSEHQKISKCFNRLRWLERERESQLLYDEMKHLKAVYKDLVAKRATPGQTVSPVYAYSRLDLLKRLAKYSEQYLPKISPEDPDNDTKDALARQFEKIQFINPLTDEVVTENEFVSSGMRVFNPPGSSAILWLQENSSIDSWNNKLEFLTSLYQLSFDAKENPPPPSEIIEEAMEMLKFVNIKDEEKVWMNLMGRRELIPLDKLRGLLFDGNEYKAVFDRYYIQATNVASLLDVAKDNYDSKKKLGRFLFEPELSVHKAICESHLDLVKRSESIVDTFNKAIEDAEVKIRQAGDDKIQIVFRLDDSQSFVYSPLKVDGGASLLVDLNKRNNSIRQLTKFHTTDTGGEYRKGCEKQKENE